MNKKTLTSILALAALNAGCSSIPQRIGIDSEFNYDTTGEFLNVYSSQETALNAAETSREAKCIKKLANEGYTYNSQVEALNALGECVDKKRLNAMMLYGSLAILTDTAKVAILYNGVKGGSSSSSPNQTFGTGGPNTNIGGPQTN